MKSIFSPFNLLMAGFLASSSNFIQANIGIKAIRATKQIYKKTSGEPQLLGAAAASYGIWRKLQTPALKNASNLRQKQLGLLGLGFAYYGYTHLTKTKTYQALQKKWAAPSYNEDVADLKDFFNKMAQPVSVIGKLGAAYYFGTKFLGKPTTKYITEQHLQNAVGTFMTVGLGIAFHQAFANHGIMASETIRPTYPTTKFKDLAQSAIPQQMRETAERIKKRVQPQGMVLYGDPGNGKTTLVEALAGETGVPLFTVKISDIKRDGNAFAENNLGIIFMAATTHAMRHPLRRAIIFLDEIEMLAAKRNTKEDGNNAALCGYLLNLISTYKGLITVVGCTNYPEKLDGAAVRHGRLGEKIEVPAPDEKAQAELFKVAIIQAHEKVKDPGMSFEPYIPFEDINPQELALVARRQDSTFVQSAAFITECVHEAYRTAFMEERDFIDQKFMTNIIIQQVETETRFKRRSTPEAYQLHPDSSFADG